MRAARASSGSASGSRPRASRPRRPRCCGPRRTRARGCWWPTGRRTTAECRRMIRRGRIELRERRKSRRLGRSCELVDVETADGRDPFAGRQRGRLRRDRRKHGFDRIRVLEPRVVARPQSEQHDVVVVVDEARNSRAPSKVDSLRAGCPLGPAADGREPVADDEHRRDDRVASIHRVDTAVDEQQVAAERTVRVLRERRRYHAA